jgi:hypothetical protein
MEMELKEVKEGKEIGAVSLYWVIIRKQTTIKNGAASDLTVVTRDSCGRNLQVSGISAKEANECSIKPINDRFSNNGQEPRPGIILCRLVIAFLH